MKRLISTAASYLAILTIGGLCFCPIALGVEQDEGPALTVYSTADPAGFDPMQFIAQQRGGGNPMFAWQVPGYGVVKEVRTVDLKEGTNELRFDDVAQFIDPTTVSFADLTDAGTAVLEQRFEFDLVSPEKLMEKYLDRPITVYYAIGEKAEVIAGTLLSATQGQLVLGTDQGVQIVDKNTGRLLLGELPGGLITKPTLVWNVRAGQAGQHKIRSTYQTNGITWRADYNLVLNAEDTKSDVSAWVTLMNLSGAGYKNARLKLIAGDVQRIQPPMYDRRAGRMEMARAAMAEDDAGFQEKSFFEYHLYTLPRRTDVPMNATQQITLFPTAQDVTVAKVLVYDGFPMARHWGYYGEPNQAREFGDTGDKKVDVFIRFKNEKENKLGIPMPKGKVRVYKQDDADGTLEFIGEDLIDHTPKDETLLIKIGQSFDVVGERTQTDFEIDTRRRIMEESYKIQIRNHKETEQKVIIRETMFRWSQWEVTQKSDDFEKIDARTIHFPVSVPKDGEKTVTYTVRYTW